MPRISKRRSAVVILLTVFGMLMFISMTLERQTGLLPKSAQTTVPVAGRSIDSRTQTQPPRDLLENITKPYYTVIKDKGFGPSGKYFALRESKVTDVPKKFLITGERICSGSCPRVLFLIMSVVSNASEKARQEIRKTWASTIYGENWLQNSNKRLAFVVGASGLEATKLESLKNESAAYGDIVVGDFKDTYANLSLKMVTSIRWIAHFCANIDLVVKVDMDTFVNVDAMLSLVSQLPRSTHPNFLFGSLHKTNHPPVLRTGKWAVSESLYPYDEYPRYVYGHSYVISGSAVRVMAESLPFFPIVPNEDAYLTGILPIVHNFTRFHHDSFAKVSKRTFCKMVHNSYVSALITKSGNREKLWGSLKTGNCTDDPV